jgi:hypothetical protein
MIRIASDPAMNQKMGEAAWRKGARHNTWQDYGDRLLAEYRVWLQERSTTGRVAAS